MTSKPSRGLSVTGKTRESVVAFFTNMLDRKFTDAEREIENIKQRKFTDEDFKQGYLNALEGQLLSVRSGDEREFYNRVHMTKENLEKYRKEFKEIRKTPIRTQFDSGYFAAWSDIFQFRLNSET